MIENLIWIFLVLGTSVNALIWSHRSKDHIETNPELEESYKRLIKSYLIYANIPWLVMGLLTLTGAIQSPFEILQPSNLKVGVIVWHISLFTILGLGTYWIFIKNGAQILVKHHVLFENSFRPDKKISAGKIKFLWIIGLIGAIVGEIFMWTFKMVQL